MDGIANATHEEHSVTPRRRPASVPERRERGTITGMSDTPSTRPLLDKLGVRPDSRVAIAGVDDAEFRRLLDQRTSDIHDLASDEVPPAGSDLSFLAADSIDDLIRIGVVRGSLVPDGAIWVVSRKGREATLRDVDVIDAAKSMGLVDNKVVSFSATHTALRLVIPKALRAALRRVTPER
jgi:hypothetical protein